MKDFKSVIAEVKQAYNIVDYIETSGINLSRAGTNKWKGLCPFHSEKTPSFVVDENFQNFMCFGCGAKGDIIKFAEETEHLDFIEVIKKLAEEKNITLDFDNTTDESSIDYKSLRLILKDTANFYVSKFRKLEKDHPARTQITDRGLSVRKVIYGYAPENRTSLYTHLKNRGYSDELMAQVGVINIYENGGISDFWNGRLMFIITDVRGRPIGFSGRKLYENDKRGKYINSKDNPIFDKGNSLYNLSKANETARKEKTIYISEGQFDVSAFIEANIPNVVASSGTAFTEKQALICRRIVGENGKIIFAFDGDKAGIEAALKVFKNIPILHSQSLVIVFPDNQDPSDYRKEHGNKQFRQYVETNSIPMIQFVLDEIAKKYDLDNELEKNKYIKESVKAITQISSNTLKEFYIKKIALNALTSLDVIRTAFKNENKNIKENKETFEIDKIEENENIEENSLIYKIINNPLYDIYARMIRLAIENEKLLDKLPKMISFIPKDLQELVKEISNAKPPFIAEKFKDSETFKFIISKDDWFPLVSLMSDEEIFSHFKFLFNKAQSFEKEKREERVYRKISKIISSKSNNENDLELLKFALLKEKEVLKGNSEKNNKR